MKKISYTFIGLLLCFNVLSQVERGKALLSLDFSYVKAPSETGVTSDRLFVNTQRLNIGSQIEYFVSCQFSLGVGLDYQNQKDDRVFTTSLLEHFAQGEAMEMKQTALLPNLFASYYYNIAGKLYFSSSLILSYGNVKSDYITKVLYAERIIGTVDSNQNRSGSYSMEQETEAELCGIALKPKLNYFFNNRIGLYVGLGAIEYYVMDWDTENSIAGVNFAPKYWSLGFNMAF